MRTAITVIYSRYNPDSFQALKGIGKQNGFMLRFIPNDESLSAYIKKSIVPKIVILIDGGKHTAEDLKTLETEYAKYPIYRLIITSANPCNHNHLEYINDLIKNPEKDAVLSVACPEKTLLSILYKMR